ncbi:hypothetical protein HMPREF9406_0016 [Clostridium sp. HGF2]|nr:hypothetical protein HMPREF9406_0016 [Clostridium sp. HGF2]
MHRFIALNLCISHTEYSRFSCISISLFLQYHCLAYVYYEYP